MLMIGLVAASLGTYLTCQGQQPEDTGRGIHCYLLAQYKTAEGSLGEAWKYYEQIMTKTDVPLAVYKGYTQFLILNNQYQKVLDLIQKLDKNFPDDPVVQMAIIESLEHTDEHKQAIERLINLSRKNQTNQEIALKTAQVYLAQHEPENAINVIDSFLENATQKPNLFIFHFFKAQILIQLNKKQEALAAVKQCIKAHAHFDKGWLLLAMLEEQLGNLQGAIKGFSTFLDLVGQDGAVQQHLTQLMFRQKMIAEKTDTLNVSLPCIEKAMLLFEQKKPKAALEQLEECLKKTPKDTDARLLKIQILGAINQQETALACLIDWMNEEPSSELWFKTLLLMTNHGIMHSDAIRALHIVEKKHPAALLPVQYLADIYLRVDQQAPALEYLTKITTMSKDQLLCTKAYYQIACIYYEQHKFDSMVATGIKGLALTPDFAPFCNLLAYYYAGKGHDIPQANKLIAIALHSDPDNPHYKDTQSRIYYKTHDYTKASNIIESIATQMPQDPHIMKHATKIRLAMSKKKG